MFRVFSPLLLFALFGGGSDGISEAAELSYEADVRPILKTHCFQCHGERGSREGSLDLRLRRLVLKGGDSGASIVPGDAPQSLLIQRVTSGEMPPDEDKRLSPDEVKILTRWVNAKAPAIRDEPESLDPNAYFTDEEMNWWAFRPVRKPTPPITHADAATPIDAFLLAKLAELKKQYPSDERAFEFSSPANPATLIRRVYLDMLGVPPTPEQVRSFLDDGDPQAWSDLVDRVLASPLYGERWGRHWLDVAGYADSEGYTDEDPIREHAWRFRDYVIRAFNADKPFSQFVIEQLAGDEMANWPDAPLDPKIVERLTATGFLRMAPDGTASKNAEQDLARNQVVADTIQIVGGSLLGMTVHCAQCHDHRYDPIPQRDYYQLRAILEPALDWKNWRAPSKRLVSLYTDADKKQRSEIEARAKKVDAQRQSRVDFYIEKTLEHELLMVADSLQSPLREAFRTKAAKRTEEQKKLLEAHTNIAKITAGSLYLYDRRREARAKDLDKRREERLAAFVERIKLKSLESLPETSRAEVESAWAAKAEERTKRQQQLVNESPGFGVNVESLGDFDPQAARVIEQYATAAAEIRKFRIRDELQKYADQAKSIRDTIPREHFLRVLFEQPQHAPATFVFHRGDHQQPKEQVEPKGLSILAAPTTSPVKGLRTSGRRLQYARYLTSGRHPLVARVMVNRIWAHHFGRGIVATTGDFGVLGDRPTHPALLDWLAAEFVESNWSVKRLHRLILLSRVYRQSAVGAENLVAADPDNLLLGRWPLRRLESESLRDAMLQVAGSLNAKMFGQPVPVMEDEVGQIVLGKENLDGERKPTKPIPLNGEEFRRSVYIQVRRTRPYGVLESFDIPDLSPNCTERPSSNVAPQSLMLMNSDFAVAVSTAMAERLIRERPDNPAAQLRRGWELAFGRQPSEAELAFALRFLNGQIGAFAARDMTNGGNTKSGGKTQIAEHEANAGESRSALATYCQALLGSNQFLYIE